MSFLCCLYFNECRLSIFRQSLYGLTLIAVRSQKLGCPLLNILHQSHLLINWEPQFILMFFLRLCATFSYLCDPYVRINWSWPVLEVINKISTSASFFISTSIVIESYTWFISWKKCILNTLHVQFFQT